MSEGSTKYVCRLAGVSYEYPQLHSPVLVTGHWKGAWTCPSEGLSKWSFSCFMHGPIGPFITHN